MTYEDRLRLIRQTLVELATSPDAETRRLVEDLLVLRQEVDLQIVALKVEFEDEDGEPSTPT